MSRTNTTHLSRLARSVTHATDLTYTQALTFCRDAAAAGALPPVLDERGMAEAVRRLTRAIALHMPARCLAARVPAVFGHDPQGATVGLLGQELASHTLVVGLTGSGASLTPSAIAGERLQDGWSVVVLDVHDDTVSWQRLAATHTVDYAPVGPSPVDLGAREGITHLLPADTEVPADAVEQERWTRALSGLLELARRRTDERAEVPLLVVVPNAHLVDRDTLLELQARARAARIALVLSCGSSADWARQGGSDDWARVVQNTNVVVAHRVDAVTAELLGASHPELVDAAAQVDAPQGDSPLQHLCIGQAAVSVWRPQPWARLVQVCAHR